MKLRALITGRRRISFFWKFLRGLTFFFILIGIAYQSSGANTSIERVKPHLLSGGGNSSGAPGAEPFWPPVRGSCAEIFWSSANIDSTTGGPWQIVGENDGVQYLTSGSLSAFAASSFVCPPQIYDYQQQILGYGWLTLCSFDCSRGGTYSLSMNQDASGAYQFYQLSDRISIPGRAFMMDDRNWFGWGFGFGMSVGCSVFLVRAARWAVMDRLDM